MKKRSCTQKNNFVSIKLFYSLEKVFFHLPFFFSKHWSHWQVTGIVSFTLWFTMSTRRAPDDDEREREKKSFVCLRSEAWKLLKSSIGKMGCERSGDVLCECSTKRWRGRRRGAKKRLKLMKRVFRKLKIVYFLSVLNLNLQIWVCDGKKLIYFFPFSSILSLRFTFFLFRTFFITCFFLWIDLCIWVGARFHGQSRVSM